MKGDFSYVKDNALYSQLEETGVVTLRGNRYQYLFSTGFTYATTPFSDVAVNWTGQKTEYSPVNLVDYDVNSIALTYQHRLWTQVDTIAVQPYYSQISSDPTDSESYGLYLGWTRLFSETMDMRVFAGARRTETEFTFVRQRLVPIAPPLPVFRVVNETVTQVSQDWGWLADIAFTWRGRTYSTTAGYTHDLAQGSGGSPLERDRCYLNLTRKLTDRLNASFYASFILTKSDSEFSRTDSTGIYASPSLSYRLTEDHSLVFGYAYSRYTNDTLAENKTLDRNRVWVALTLQFPKKWARGI